MPTVKETVGIPPPPGAAAELKLPLSLFDVWWIHVQPTRRLLFYNYPCSTANFLDTVVPKLKESLSLTLKHYLLAAGNLLVPSDGSRKPEFRYVAGDSVPLTITESSRDFADLTGNHPRDADQFYEFMPPLPPAKEEPGFRVVPLLALQVTLFPGRGLSIGAANHHSLGDARSMVGFMSAWAEINKSGGDSEFLKKDPESLPVFDRSVVKDSAGIDSILWNVVKQIPFNPSPPLPLPTKRVRSTFLLRQSDLKKLKSLISAAKSSVGLVTSFVAAAAYTWSCLAKSADAAGEKIDGGAKEAFFIIADARGRPNAIIDPPVPANYFGNCLGGGAAVVDHEVLASEEGFPAAAEAIAEEIKQRVNNKDEFLKGAENWASGVEKYMGMRSLGVADSPKFDLYAADFGWGKPKKVELVFIDEGNYTMSLCNSDAGGLEVGMSLPKETMEAFAALFASGLDR